MTKRFFVYIMTNAHNSVLYTGVTSDIVGRVHQHRIGVGGSFSGKYRTTKLVYYEEYTDSLTAITREKQIKAGSRKTKLELIERINPEWGDLSKGAT